MIWQSISFDFDNEFKFIFSDFFTPNILSGKKHSEEILGYLSKLTILSSYLLLRLNWIYSGRCILDLDFFIGIYSMHEIESRIAWKQYHRREKNRRPDAFSILHFLPRSVIGAFHKRRQNFFWPFLIPPSPMSKFWPWFT